MNTRTVLVIADLVHAYPRIPGLAKYLPAYGWRPVIVCPPVPGGTSAMGFGSDTRVFEAPHAPILGSWKAKFGVGANEGLRAYLRNRSESVPRHQLVDRLLGLMGELINYPDAHRRWLTPALRKIEQVMGVEDISAVLSTSSPVTTHVIAHHLKVRQQLVWVADLRDLWSQNHNYEYSALRRRIDRRLERKTLGLADALVTVSEPWADRLREMHVDKKVYRIPNGFDPAHLRNRRAELSTQFTVAYTGRIYPEKQNPRPFFMALRRLLDEGIMNPHAITVRLYTPKSEWLERQIREAGVSDAVSQDGMVSHQAALEHQRTAHALLLLNWDDPNEKGTYPLKVFEYLAAKRPILAIGGTGDDIVSGLLNETQAGKSCVDGHSAFEYLRELCQEFKATGTVASHAIESKVAQYGYDRMSEQFAKVLDTAIEQKKGARRA